MRRPSSQAIAVMALVTGCANDVCVMPPCAQPIAVRINVSSAVSTDSLSGVFVTINGGLGASCAPDSTATSCYVLGSAGHYDLQIGAAGFQTVTRAVDVAAEAAPRCGCAPVETATLNVQLSPQS